MTTRTHRTAAADVLDERALRRMDNGELDLLFRSSPGGAIPRGRLQGTALLFPGSRICGPLATVVRLAFWQGKVTDDSARSLENLIGPFGIRTIKARISRGGSWVDGEDCVLIDYSQTSLVARMVRDEIRQVAPGLYLGLAWLRHRRAGWFTVRQQ